MSLAVVGVDGPASATDGHVALYNGPTGKLLKSAGFAPREVLTANRTYYVRTDGSDSNTGLANSSGGAFLTIQKALNVAATIDFGGYVVTIQVGDGTYTGASIIPVTVGQAGVGNLVIQGNSGTPANVIISTTSASCFTANKGAVATVKDMELRTTTNGFGLYASGGYIAYTNVNFGACAQGHVFIGAGGLANATGNYTINGSSPVHVWARDAGEWLCEFVTVTLTGTPAFSTAFALASMLGIIESFTTFSGSATGTRYNAQSNSAIQTNGGGASYFPGNGAGSTATGGQYL